MILSRTTLLRPSMGAFFAVFALLAALGISPAQAGTAELEYAIELTRDGSTKVVPENHNFTKSDQIRLRVTPRSSLYVYVLTRGTSGKYSLLYPAQDTPGLASPQPARKALVVPQSGSFVLSGEPGIEQLILIGTPERLPVLDFLGQIDQLTPEKVEKAVLAVRQWVSSDGEFKRRSAGGTTRLNLKTKDAMPVIVADVFLLHR